MNTTFLILIAIIYIILFGKWILFVILSPFLIICNIYKYRHALIVTNQNLVNQDDNNIDLRYPCKKIKSIIRIYIEGYMRYMQLQVSMIPSHLIRNFIYKKVFLVKMEQYSIIYYGAEIRGSYLLTIGRGSIIGDKAVLDARRGGIEIGKNVQLGSFVKLWTGSHNHEDPYFRSTPDKRGPIKIGDRAWLGPNVTVLHSVTIGEGAVIAAGSVVTKDVEPYSIMGGIPAKKIGQRNTHLVYNFKGNAVPFY